MKNLQTLTLNLGEHTTVPHASVGVSVDYAPFATVNVSAGANVIPLSSDKHGSDASSVVRINVEGWQNNRVNLESIVLNAVSHQPIAFFPRTQWSGRATFRARNCSRTSLPSSPSSSLVTRSLPSVAHLIARSPETY